MADRVDDLERVVQTTAVTAVSDIAKLREGLLFGNTLVALEGEGVFQIVLCATDEDGGRDIQEPNSDVTLRGPRAGFTENYEKNIAAIRRIIRNEALAFEEFVVSEQTSTRVVLAYINGAGQRRGRGRAAEEAGRAQYNRHCRQRKSRDASQREDVVSRVWLD